MLALIFISCDPGVMHIIQRKRAAACVIKNHQLPSNWWFGLFFFVLGLLHEPWVPIPHQAYPIRLLGGNWEAITGIPLSPSLSAHLLVTSLLMAKCSPTRRQVLVLVSNTGGSICAHLLTTHVMIFAKNSGAPGLDARSVGDVWDQLEKELQAWLTARVFVLLQTPAGFPDGHSMFIGPLHQPHHDLTQS